MRKLISAGFDIALDTGVAIGFHVDNSMFWSQLKILNARDSIEWLDWQGQLNTGQRLDWSLTPIKIMPQLCLNSKAVREAVSARAALIGNEIAKGVERLEAAHKTDLFIGVIAGWETRIGRDFDTGKYLGYCALTNAGYGPDNPPPNPEAALGEITKEFIGFWAQSLITGGVPADKVFSHIAFQSLALRELVKTENPGKDNPPYLRAINYTPPAVAFCDQCKPGFSTYPQPGLLEQWHDELNKHGNPPWASCEGTAVDPGAAERSGKGMSMEGYLGNMFNHGAVLVNVFGWGVGDRNNPFRKIAENDAAVAAYQKFLRGEALHETPIAFPAIPPDGFIDNMHKLQAELPGWIQKNGPTQVKDNVAQLQKALNDKLYDVAAQAVRAILDTIEK